MISVPAAASEKTPWWQAPAVLFVNTLGCALQDEANETPFITFSSLAHPGVTARIVSSKHQTIKGNDYLVLICEQCVPIEEGAAMQFPILLPLEIESPAERVENMKITKTRRHPCIAFLATLLNL